MTHADRPIVFRDRLDAAHRLAERLQAYRGQKPLVLAIPRGAVPMAKSLAAALQGDFDVVLVRKLRAPDQPEFAIGSVDESGWTYLAPYAAVYGADQHYIAAEKHRQLDTIRQRRAQYTPIRPPLDPAGRTVIVVDDGLATGATALVALRSLRRMGAARLVLAVPVGPYEAVQRLRREADVVVCLEQPPDFTAVGAYYDDFGQTSDAEVVSLLDEAARRVSGG